MNIWKSTYSAYRVILISIILIMIIPLFDWYSSGNSSYQHVAFQWNLLIICSILFGLSFYKHIISRIIQIISVWIPLILGIVFSLGAFGSSTPLGQFMGIQFLVMIIIIGLPLATLFTVCLIKFHDKL